MNLVLAMILVAVALLAIQVLITAKGSRETRRIHATLMANAKKRARRTFSVIIPLARRAEIIFPLLDHLYAQQYDKLQIVVIVKQTAGRNAEKDLLAYRKSHKVKGLKVVRHTAGMDVKSAASGQYVVEMQPNDRLTSRFFEVTSLVLTTQQPDALAVRTIILPGHTFAQAYNALGVLLQSVAASLFPRLLPSSHYIFRRVMLGKDRAVKPVHVASYQFGLYEENNATYKDISFKTLFVSILAGPLVFGALFAGYLFSDPLFLPVEVAFVVGAYVLLTAIIFMAIHGHRFIDYCNTLLFIPLAPLYALGVLITRGTKLAIAVLRRK